MMIIWKSDYFSIIIFLMIISIIFDIIFFPIKFFANNKEKVAFNNEFKKIFVFNSLSKYFKELKYLPNGGISKYDIESYSTLDTADSFSSNDYVSGLYKDIKFEQESNKDSADSLFPREQFIIAFVISGCSVNTW